MDEQPKHHGREDISDSRTTFETLGRAGVALSASAYVLGLVITNIHLSTLGFPPPDLVQGRYILVGTSWFALSAFMLTIMLVAWRIGKRIIVDTKEHDFVSVGLLALMLAAVIAVPILAAVTIRAFLGTAAPWVTFYVVAASAGLNALAIIWLWTAAARVISADYEARVDPELLRHMDIFHVLGGALLLLLAVYTYARTAYTHLPSGIGGGKASMVTLVAADTETAILHQLNLPRTPDGLWGPVELALEDADTFFILRREGSSVVPIRVSKDSCKGVRHSPR